MSLEDGFGIGKVKFRQKHEESESVGQTAEEQLPLPHLRWKILMEQKKIVAEVEIGLLRISLIERSAPYVENLRVRDSTDPEPGGMYAAAEVDLLHMGKKILVEASKLQV